MDENESPVKSAKAFRSKNLYKMGKSMPTIEPESPLKTPNVQNDKILKPFISVLDN